MQLYAQIINAKYIPDVSGEFCDCLSEQLTERGVPRFTTFNQFLKRTPEGLNMKPYNSPSEIVQALKAIFQASVRANSEFFLKLITFTIAK